MVSEIKKRKSKKGETDDHSSPPSSSPVNSEEDGTSTTVEPVPVNGLTDAPLRYGRMPTFSGQRLWSRSALILGLMTVVYYNSNHIQESSFGKYEETISGKAFETKCSNRIEAELKSYKGCRVSKCGRILVDLLDVSLEFGLSNLAERIFSKANGNSGIYDLFNGKLFHDKEVDLIQLHSIEKSSPIFRTGDAQYVHSIETALHHLISSHFKLDSSELRLNSAFYTQLTPTGRKRNQLCRRMVHLEAFSSHFSAIITLSDFGKDFTGGRLVFPDSDFTNRTVEERKGRVLAFTAGVENQIVLEPVTKGKIITLTMGFTCDSKKQPKMMKLPSN